MKNKYPLPLISELINKLQGAKYFTKLDIQWGLNNVRMKEGDEWKAVFQTNHGLFEPLVMFFGLTNSLAMFQTMMDKIFEELIIEGTIVVYLDDILIFTNTLEQHQKVTHQVLHLLCKHDLFLKLKQTEVEIISHNSVKIDPVKFKVTGVIEWPAPTTGSAVIFGASLIMCILCLTSLRMTLTGNGVPTNNPPLTP